MESQKKLTVPIQWKKLILPVIWIILGSVLLFYEPSKKVSVSIGAILSYVMGLFMFFIGLFSLFEYLTEYTFSPEGITVRYFGLIVRRISWDRIGHAIYVYAWCDVGYPYYQPYRRYMPHLGQIIYVTLKGNVWFTPEQDVRWIHRLTHLFSTFCIFLPPINVPIYTGYFQKYYPNLKRQDDESATYLGAHQYDYFERRWLNRRGHPFGCPL